MVECGAVKENPLPAPFFPRSEILLHTASKVGATAHSIKRLPRELLHKIAPFLIQALLLRGLLHTASQKLELSAQSLKRVGARAHSLKKVGASAHRLKSGSPTFKGAAHCTRELTSPFNSGLSLRLRLPQAI